MSTMHLKFIHVIVSLCLITWTTFLYYFLMQQINVKEGANSVFKDLKVLEGRVSNEYRVQKELFSKIHEYMNTLKEQNKSLDGVINAIESEVVKYNVALKDQIPVLIFACNRITVSTCLDKIFEYRPDNGKFPVVVSQDCDHPETTEVIESYGSKLKLIQQPDQSLISVPPREKKFSGYYKIARHYGWALNQIFFTFNYSNVIIVEDDLEIAPDFFEYFLGTYDILQSDPSIWCISAWNDNGKTGLIDLKNADLLYRTDFFPGLGWMMTKNLWTELSPKWPKAYWDDWIREPSQRQSRSCIRPEVSRTRTFGKKGVSNGLFFDKHLKFITLNEKFVPFTQMDLGYLMKDRYDKDFIAKVYQTAVVTYDDLKRGKVEGNHPVRILYRTRDEFKVRAKSLGLMDDFKSGVPRTAYRGIITFHYNSRMVHLAPNMNWNGYDPSWS